MAPGLLATAIAFLDRHFGTALGVYVPIM